MRFVDLFAGLGGFHLALHRLGMECVYACEVDPELRSLYAANFPNTPVFGDIRETKGRIPPHDVLCAGFPCQPFSKSGYQSGANDKTRGTLFHDIVEVVKTHRPKLVLLENVGNFERHDGGNTWRVAKSALQQLGYKVRGTEHKASGGHGLISPHHFGFPHHRERFFVVAALDDLPADPFPRGSGNAGSILESVVEGGVLSHSDRLESRLTDQQRRCIDTWNRFLKMLPKDVALPPVPVWADEFGATYPFEDQTPFVSTTTALRRAARVRADRSVSRAELLERLPRYARTKDDQFPAWKVRFIAQNRGWYRQYREYVPREVLTEIRAFPPSLRKLEWNCNGERRDLWRCVLQFRPSGLRAKQYTSVPALVAMTTTQIPILGPQRRFLTRVEGLRLQGFPDTHALPASRARSFAALGNAVHVDVVEQVARSAFSAIGVKP